ncbi:hypothetical protein GCM10027275_31030 [Rhabdobacter roseus]|uniref:Lipoprotein n=1 Tax=Rhabdobacter roseus TaxID=1655419 RepID=A0A840TU24_9BACT|nr:hypothetical protein [Rhabdobacter roseus]MBB5285062.1 hypothetical protein [Rhabdobacter roseus]
MRTCVTKLLLLSLLAAGTGCGRHDDINKQYVFTDFSKAYKIKHVPKSGNVYSATIEGHFDGKLRINSLCYLDGKLPFTAGYSATPCYERSKEYVDSVKIDVGTFEIYVDDMEYNTYIYPNTARRGKVTVTIREWTPKD